MSSLVESYQLSVERYERLSLLCLGIGACLHVWLGPNGIHIAVADLVAYMVVISLAFHLTEGMLPLERTGRLIMVGVACMFLYRSTVLWYQDEVDVPMQELVRAGARWGFQTFLLVWTALVSRIRPPGQYAYNLLVVGTLSMALGQCFASVLGVGPTRFGPAIFRALVEGFTTGAAFSYVTLGRYVEVEEDDNDWE